MTLKKALLTRYVIISIVVAVFILFLVSGCYSEHSEAKEKLIRELKTYQSNQSVDTIVHDINANCMGIPSIFFVCHKSGNYATTTILCREPDGTIDFLLMEELTFVTKCTHDATSTDQEETS